MPNMNPIETYRDAGRKAGRAAKNHDAGAVRHWREWVSRALRLETPEYRATAQAAYNEAYTDEASPR